MMTIAVAAFWAVWSFYLTVQVFRVKNYLRIGYALSAILTAFTAYLLAVTECL